jgi:hypothetical protein
MSMAARPVISMPVANCFMTFIFLLKGFSPLIKLTRMKRTKGWVLKKLMISYGKGYITRKRYGTGTVIKCTGNLSSYFFSSLSTGIIYVITL